MQVFEWRGLDLTVGVIDNYFANDPVIVSYVKGRLAGDPLLEVANQGWNHEKLVLLDMHARACHPDDK